MAINISPLTGFNIRSANIAMKASMIRFAFKSYPNAVEENKALIQTTLECVPLKHLSAVIGYPTTPGWDSSAYVSNVAHAMMHDREGESRIPEFEEFMKKTRAMIGRSLSIKEIAIQKKCTAS